MEKYVKLFVIPFAAVLCFPRDRWFCVGGTRRICCGLLSLGAAHGVADRWSVNISPRGSARKGLYSFRDFGKQPQSVALGGLEDLGPDSLTKMFLNLLGPQFPQLHG